MSIRGNFFVTPHAVHQFQRRIADIGYERARDCILDGLAYHAMPLRWGRDTQCYRVRVRSATGYPYDFRAVIGPPEAGKRLPVVMTILISGATRAARRARRAWLGYNVATIEDQVGPLGNGCD